MKTTGSENPSIAAAKEKLLAELRSAAADAGELLSVTASLAAEKIAVASGLIQQNLQVVKDSMVAAEAAEIKSVRQAAMVTGQHIHDHHWNYR